jgi:hypothetical protein
VADHLKQRSDGAAIADLAQSQCRSSACAQDRFIVDQTTPSSLLS